MQTPATAASAPRKVTMLFAVVATGAASVAALVDGEPTAPAPTAIAEAPRPEPADQAKREPEAPVVRVDRPLILRSGAPACGNTMSKAGRPIGCRTFRPDMIQKLEWNTVKVKVNVHTGKPERR